MEDQLERITRHAVRSEHPQRVQRLRAVADHVPDVIKFKNSMEPPSQNVVDCSLLSNSTSALCDDLFIGYRPAVDRCGSLLPADVDFWPAVKFNNIKLSGPFLQSKSLHFCQVSTLYRSCTHYGTVIFYLLLGPINTGLQSTMTRHGVDFITGFRELQGDELSEKPG